MQKGAVHLLWLRSELVTNSHTDFLAASFSSSGKADGFWAAPLFPPGLAMCCKCCSERWVTNFYTADAVQMATPAWSSKKVENLLHNNCCLPPKATIWGILLLQVKERATGQTLLAHRQEHSLIGKLKQQAVGNPRNQDWWLKWAPSLSPSHWSVLASRWASP